MFRTRKIERPVKKLLLDVVLRRQAQFHGDGEPPGKLVPRLLEDSGFVIEQALSSGQAGRGGTVLLSAPSGRGISHRLSHAADRARDRGMHVAGASGRPAERSLAFSIATELLEPLWQVASSPALRAELADGPAHAAVGLVAPHRPAAPPRGGGC